MTTPRAKKDRAALKELQNLGGVSKGKRIRTSSWKDRFHVLPDFIVIGAQKCGTWTLYHNLSQHPSMFPASRKEVHFFDHASAGGELLYRAHFPTYATKWKARLSGSHSFVTGEASPFYLFHPAVPSRVHAMLPNVKLIALLRNPVSRAYSHYQQEILKERETLSFEEALDREEERLAGECDRVMNDRTYNSFALRVYSYASRGRYAEQLKRWFQHFPRNQFLILESNAFRNHPGDTFASICRFLEIPEWTPPDYEEVHVRDYAPMAEATKQRLQEYFRPHNQRLYELLGHDFAWD